MTSVTRTNQSVSRPGSDDKDSVSFQTLSVTGGIVNAYNALKMAEQVSNGKARP